MCIYVCAYMSISVHLLVQGCVCTHTCMLVHVSTGIFGGQKVVSDPFEVSYGLPNIGTGIEPDRLQVSTCS